MLYSRIRGAISAALVTVMVASGLVLGGSAAMASPTDGTSAVEMDNNSVSAPVEPLAPGEADSVIGEQAPTESSEKAPEDSLDESAPIPGGVPESVASTEPTDPVATAEPVNDPAPDADGGEDSARAADAQAASARAALPSSLDSIRENGGALDWGFLSRWRVYITSMGTQTPYGGATENADGTIHYPESVGSSYNSSSGVGTLEYTGGVLWSNPTHGISIAMQNPQIEIAHDGSAVVTAEMSKTDVSGASDVGRVIIANTSATGAAVASADLQEWTEVAGVFAGTLAPDGLAQYAGSATDPFTFSGPAPESPATPIWTPSMSVALADGTPLASGDRVYRDDELVVNGSGFDPESHPRPNDGRPPVTAGDPTGNYVVFGNFAQAWRPSASGTKAADRVVADQKWAMSDTTYSNVDPNFVAAVKAQRVTLNADGSFVASLTAQQITKDAPTDGSFGVFTYVAGGGGNDASQELELHLNYIDSERPKTLVPSITVELADGTALASGDKVYRDDDLVVKGSGFDPESHPRPGDGRPPVTEGDPTGNYAVFGNFAQAWQPSTGATGGTRVVADQKWAMTDATYGNLGPNFVAAVKAQRVTLNTDGSFVASLTAQQITKNAPTGGSFGVFTYVAGGGANDAAQELELRVTYVDTERPKSWTPKVSVELADGTPLASGDKVYRDDDLVVMGSGFDPESHPAVGRPPVTTGDPTGNYVVFGNFAQAWQPSTSETKATDRVVADQKWAMTDATFGNINPMFVGGVTGQRVTLNTDGSFVAPLTAKNFDTTKNEAPMGGSFGVFTYVAGGGADDAAQELELRLEYVDSERPATPIPGSPKLRVFLANGTTPYSGQLVAEGDKLVIKGSGFDPYVNKCQPGQPVCDLGGLGTPIPADKPQGTFAVFGHFAQDWKPSAGASSDKRKMDKSNRAWALAADTLDNDVPAEHRDTIRSEWVGLDPVTGAFTWTVTLKEPQDLVSGGKFGIYSYAGGVGTKNAAQELAVAINFKGKDRNPEPEVDLKKGGLKWGVRDSFRNYVEDGAGGAITMLGSAKRSGGVFEFPQTTGGNWSERTATGEVRYAGGVAFSGHGGALALTLVDPVIKVESAKRAVLSAKIDNKLIPVANIDLSKMKPATDKGAVTWTGASTTLRAEAVTSFLDFYPAGSEMDPVTFTVGATAVEKPIKPVVPKPAPTPKPKPIPNPEKPVAPAKSDSTQSAGSLSWGISGGFANYTTGRIAKGQITTNGVGSSGGGYLFPQANSSWNQASATGTVQYSGVVTFSGHQGLMTESFANPVITVTSMSAATLSVGGRSFGLDLSAATKAVGANGEIAWSGVPVSGTISGSGGGGGGAFSPDPLTFSIGAASGVAYGSTSVAARTMTRTAAEEPPATTGIRVLTPAKKLVPGGEIEFEADGFEAGERDVLVVLYSDPIVLDEQAGADANGMVRWIGTLPKDLAPGQHTITLQGSINAGAEITVVKGDPTAKKAKSATQQMKNGQVESLPLAAPAAAGLAVESGPVWLWWVGAGSLLIIAAAMGGLVAVQRSRRNS